VEGAMITAECIIGTWKERKGGRGEKGQRVNNNDRQKLLTRLGKEGEGKIMD